MIRLLKQTEIIRYRWDQVVLSSQNAMPYAKSWYLDAVFGDRWSALIEDDYKAVMPLPIKEKYFVNK